MTPQQNLTLLDCTLRDGGYVNDWEFGREQIISIFERLVSAGVDIIEIGFLDERRKFDPNRSIFPSTKAAEETFGDLDHGQSMIVAMIDIGTCSIGNIQPCAECFLDGIRVIFKKDRLQEAMEFCAQLKSLGYKVFANAVSITSYGEQEYGKLLQAINRLEPYTFSIVDTYGLLHRSDVDSYYMRAERELKPQIGIAYHAHNNFQLAFSNCIEVIEAHRESETELEDGSIRAPRRLTVDGSLYAMGKSAGNAATELLAMYMNENCGKDYDISQLLEAIDTTIMDEYRRAPWGYQFKFFISALNDCHPSYVSYLMDKRKLSAKSINQILQQLPEDERLLYNEELIERLYVRHQSVACDDAGTRLELMRLLTGRKVMLLAPGNNIVDQRERAMRYINSEIPIVISVGFVPNGYPIDFVFMSNAKRYTQLSSFLSRMGKGSAASVGGTYAGATAQPGLSMQSSTPIRTIATSNVTKASGEFDFVLNYATLVDDEAMLADNPLIMLLRLLGELEVAEVALAGFDGYTTRPASDYVNPNMEYDFSKSKALELNADAVASIKRLHSQDALPPIRFVTDSLYEEQL